MRRTLAAAFVAVSLTATVLPVVSSSATTAVRGAAVTVAADDEVSPQEVLAQAARIFAEGGDAQRSEARVGTPDATLALTELFNVRDRLTGDDRLEADALLARPTDGARDPYGDGYGVRAAKKCKQNVCLHWVRKGADAPPSTKWAMKTLATMNKVWKFEVGRMGYRRPVQDRGVGGNKTFDVYLKELGGKGIYGYCAPEYRAPGLKYVASGFCVLDDDFAKAQFGAPPVNSMKVTAAHEFFHAIQFAYDYTEDNWLKESTATWMEERFADKVNDNRQYLPYGQLSSPGRALDTFNPKGVNQYGNWVFWEYLSQRKGNGIIKAVWNRAGAFKGAPNDYSTQALKKVLASRGGFTSVFRAYAAANAIASRKYSEGKAWPAANIERAFTLQKNKRRVSASTRINHMAANHIVFRTGKSLKGKKWKLRVVVDAPNRKAGGAAYLIVKKRKGGWITKPIKLTRKGIGSVKFSFTKNSVKSAIVTLVNANTSFKCRKNNPYYSCAGNPTGDNRLFKIKAQVLKR